MPNFNHLLKDLDKHLFFKKYQEIIQNPDLDGLTTYFVYKNFINHFNITIDELNEKTSDWLMAKIKLSENV